MTSEPTPDLTFKAGKNLRGAKGDYEDPEPTPDLAFEAALDQLGRIVSDLEQGEPELAAALAKYEQAIRLLAHCHALIDGAEQTVALLTGVDDQGQPITTPFDASATTDREPSTAPARKVSPDGANRSRSRDSDNSSPPF
jgi:exodeoxyribonuclease VII small subunit